jgi:Zn-dependent protease with chaperone function
LGNKGESVSLQFPDISVPGGQIDPRDYVERGTGLALFGAFFIAGLVALFGVLITYGILLIVLLLYLPFTWYLRKKALALIHGSGVLVSECQSPEIHACMMTFKQRLGITRDVSVYIVAEQVVNAFAVRYGKKNVILLTDHLIHGCLASQQPHTLSFIIAHELGHIALNHNGVLRSWLARYHKRLRRLDEYSVDAVATALVQDTNTAYTGLLLLTIGYALLRYVDTASILTQAQEVAKNKYSKKAEKRLTHPLLLNRLYRILQK